MTDVNTMNAQTKAKQKEDVAIAHFRAIKAESQLTIDRCNRAIRSLTRKV